MKKDFRILDVTKFVCAILVVMIHVPPFGNNETLDFIFQKCLAKIAVPFFFCFIWIFII